MKKIRIALLFFLISKLCFGQEYLLSNEEVIFSFRTNKGKKMVLAKDRDNEYIVYRFGTSKKIELEYPEKNKESWNKFNFAYYSRGGGVQNLAMDLNTVFFSIDNYEYSIHDNYYSETNESDAGIIIKNIATDKTSEIKGKYNSVQGSLYKFRDNNLLAIDEDKID